MSDIAGLDPEERLLLWMPVSFAGSAGTSLRASLSPRPERIRRAAFSEWAAVADGCGFPVATSDMVIGVSDHQRLHLWRPRFLRARPGAYAGWFPLARVAQVAVARYGAVARLTMLIDDGALVAVESMRVGRLQQLAALVAEETDR